MTNLASYSSGVGHTVIYLHGFCENKAIWTDFIQLLPQNYQHFALDLPGFGGSSENLNYSSMELMADQVYNFMDNQRIRKASFVCHSMGGYVALALAEAHPEVFAGLCLFHSTALADSEEKKHSRDKTAEFIKGKGLAVFLENFVPGMFYKGRREELTKEIEQVKKITMYSSAEVAATTTLAMRNRPDRTHVLERVNFPLTFISGKDDELLPLAANKQQFFLPKQSTIHLLSNTGHLGFYEWPGKTALMIEGFLKSCD